MGLSSVLAHKWRGFCLALGVAALGVAALLTPLPARAQSCTAPAFATRADLSTTGSPIAVAAVDVDRDGSLDLRATTQTAVMSLRRGNGTGGFLRRGDDPRGGLHVLLRGRGLQSGRPAGHRGGERRWTVESSSTEPLRRPPVVASAPMSPRPAKGIRGLRGIVWVNPRVRKGSWPLWERVRGGWPGRENQAYSANASKATSASAPRSRPPRTSWAWAPRTAWCTLCGSPSPRDPLPSWTSGRPGKPFRMVVGRGLAMPERVDPKESTKPDGAPGSPPGRERYEKPAVAWEEVLETRPGLMQGCAKLPGQTGPCESATAS